MTVMRRTSALVLALGLSLVPSLAGTEEYKLDPAHSTIGFRIRHLVGRVNGTFEDFSGTIVLDPEDLSTARVSVAIQAASVNTRNEKRDNHLRTEEFFAVKEYPEIRFESTKFIPQRDGSGKLIGNLTMHGVTRPVELEVEVLGFGPDAWGGYRAGFSGRTTVNRKDYGMTWNQAMDQGGLILGEEVEIRIDLETVRQKAPETSAAESGR